MPPDPHRCCRSVIYHANVSMLRHSACSRLLLLACPSNCSHLLSCLKCAPQLLPVSWQTAMLVTLPPRPRVRKLPYTLRSASVPTARAAVAVLPARQSRRPSRGTLDDLPPSPTAPGVSSSVVLATMAPPFARIPTEQLLPAVQLPPAAALRSGEPSHSSSSLATPSPVPLAPLGAPLQHSPLSGPAVHVAPLAVPSAASSFPPGQPALAAMSRSTTFSRENSPAGSTSRFPRDDSLQAFSRENSPAAALRPPFAREQSPTVNARVAFSRENSPAGSTSSDLRGYDAATAAAIEEHVRGGSKLAGPARNTPPSPVDLVVCLC